MRGGVFIHQVKSIQRSELSAPTRETDFFKNRKSAKRTFIKENPWQMMSENQEVIPHSKTT